MVHAADEYAYAVNVMNNLHDNKKTVVSFVVNKFSRPDCANAPKRV